MKKNCKPVVEVLNECRPLWYKIAFHFGFDLKGTGELVKHVGSLSESYYAKTENISSFKILLSKALVRACIFKISVELCSKAGMAHNPYTAKDHSAFGYEQRFQDMPLSCRAVHILYEAAGFTEGEIAEILNITPFVVKERLAKARVFASHRRLASC